MYQRGNPLHVVCLPRQKQKAKQVPKRIDHADDLGRQPTARAPDGLMLSPPFAPDAFWWAWTIVPSIIAYSRSGSAFIALKRFSNTPASAHRRNRLKTEFQLPKSLGKSRQGEPVRTRQRTASINLRLSRPVAPGSPTFPGNRGPICSQSSSEITKRSSSIQTSILKA